MCDNSKCLSSQVGMNAGLFHPCFFAISIFIFNILKYYDFFTLVSVLFLNPFIDFDSVSKSTLICLYAGMC